MGAVPGSNPQSAQYPFYLLEAEHLCNRLLPSRPVGPANLQHEHGCIGEYADFWTFTCIIVIVGRQVP